MVKMTSGLLSFLNEATINMPDLQWLRNLLHLNKPLIPDELWRTCIERLPFVSNLSIDDLQRLKVFSEELLHTKTITGAGGLEITDEPLCWY